jgi:hypothetical protein
MIMSELVESRGEQFHILGRGRYEELSGGTSSGSGVITINKASRRKQIPYSLQESRLVLYENIHELAHDQPVWCIR